MSIKRFKKRNWTHKSMSEFNKSKMSYLTPEEGAALRSKNDLLHFHPETPREKSIQHLSVSPSKIQQLAKEIRKEFQPSTYIFQSDPLLYGSIHKDSGYEVLTEEGCNPRVVLDLHRWSTFPYFDVSTKTLSPNGETWLLSIDFVGNQTYHLFTKSLYSEDYREIKLPKQHRLQTKQLLANNRTSSGHAIWLDNTRILYVSINRYYNVSGVYLYDLNTKKHKLIYKNEKGTFVNLDTVTSDLFILIYVSNYNSDAVLLMDVATLKVYPFIPRKFSVSYPYLNHEKGNWIVCKRDKAVDTIATTTDFKKWDVHYQNKNPYEQILEVNYEKDHFIFTLTTLSGLCLYIMKCKKLNLLEKSFGFYKLKGVAKNAFLIDKYKYTCPYQQITFSLDTFDFVSPKMNTRYHEEEVFIHPMLRVTLLYKKKPDSKGAPCLLRGYGAYNSYDYAYESFAYYPLLERGFVVAIAHLRGGGEYGYKGYDEGRLGKKKNTFQDFIDTAHFLVEKKWTTRDKLAIWGRSCGGLLIASVLNQEPDLCRVALAGVPFVTLMDTMNTYKTPLGIETQTELGNIAHKKMKEYIHTYEPLEHIRLDGKYPHMLIYTNSNDTTVPYREPLNYYHALKKVSVYASGKSDLSFYMDARFGHFQGSLLKDRCEHYGLLFAYVLKYLNIDI